MVLSPLDSIPLVFSLRCQTDVIVASGGLIVNLNEALAAKSAEMPINRKPVQT